MKMTEAQKTQYTRSALGLAGVAVNDFSAELIWRLYEKLQELGGNFSLRDSAAIEAFMHEKYDVRSKRQQQQEVLDEMKAKPKHETLTSVLMAYIDKFWTNKSGYPSIEDFIRKNKLNNRDISFGNVSKAVVLLRKTHKGEVNWVENVDKFVHRFIQDELSATKQEAAK